MVQGRGYFEKIILNQTATVKERKKRASESCKCGNSSALGMPKLGSTVYKMS